MKKISREYLKTVMNVTSKQLNKNLKELEKAGLIKLDKNKNVVYVVPSIIGGGLHD